MIFWMTKPNALFREVLRRSFDLTLDDLKLSIKICGLHGNNTFFSNEIVNIVMMSGKLV